jgi:hypothetical protein
VLLAALKPVFLASKKTYFAVKKTYFAVKKTYFASKETYFASKKTCFANKKKPPPARLPLPYNRINHCDITNYRRFRASFVFLWGNQFPQTPSQRLPALRPCVCEFR